MRQLREIHVQGSTVAENVRRMQFAGRDYVVFDTIMLVEGVLQGANSATPEYVPATEINKAPQGWNGRPVVMNHPQINGVYVSANTPEVLEEWAFGYVFAAESVDNGKKLKSEVWIDELRADELGGEFQSTKDRLLAEEVVEVSTGLFTNVNKKNGRFNKRQYQGEWDGIVPDHLALLSEGTLGACSIADGCGANRANAANSLQVDGQISGIRLNSSALRTIDVHECDCGGTCGGCGGHDEEPAVAEKNVLEKAKELFQGGLDMVTQALGPHESAEPREPTDEELAVLNAQSALAVQAIEGSVTFDDIRTALTQALRARVGRRYVWVMAVNSDVVVYQADSDSYCCGGSYDTTYQLAYAADAEGNITFTGEPEPVRLMTKIVKAENPPATVLANEQGQPEGATQGDETMAENAATSGQADPAASTPAVESPTPAAAVTVETAAPKVLTTEEFLASAPPEVRASLQRTLAREQAQKTQLVGELKAHAGNKFTEDQLNSFSIEVLEGMAALAGVKAQAAPVDYSGRSGFGEGIHTQAQPTGASASMPAPKVFAGVVASPSNPNVKHDIGGAPVEGATQH